MTDAAKISASPTHTEEFVISRTFDAPRELVWKAFNEPERMKEWWGPKGAIVKSSKMDLRVGGTYHYGMEFGGQVMWGKFIYREITPPARLVFINHFSNEKGEITRHPMSPNWPQKLLSTITFEEEGKNRTKVTIRWMPLDATPIEVETFDQGRGSMTQGWGGTLDSLTAYLAKAN